MSYLLHIPQEQEISCLPFFQQYVTILKRGNGDKGSTRLELYKSGYRIEVKNYRVGVKTEEMKITVPTRTSVQIEDDDGNIAIFYGEIGGSAFHAYADSIDWVKCKGEATEKARLDFIHKVIEETKALEYGVLFFDSNNKILLENLLKLKIEVYNSKGSLFFPMVIVTSLVFSMILAAALAEIDSAVKITTILCLVISSPFIIYMLRIWRFKVIAEGYFIHVRPTVGREYKFSVSDITKVVQTICKDNNGIDVIEKIIIHTKTKRISINDKYMIGFWNICIYLSKLVDSSKIITKYKKR